MSDFSPSVVQAMATAVPCKLQLPDLVADGRLALGPHHGGRVLVGHVVRVEPIDTPRGKLGVGVQFDYYEILRSKTAFPI